MHSKSDQLKSFWRHTDESASEVRSDVATFPFVVAESLDLLKIDCFLISRQGFRDFRTWQNSVITIMVLRTSPL